MRTHSEFPDSKKIFLLKLVDAKNPLVAEIQTVL